MSQKSDSGRPSTARRTSFRYGVPNTYPPAVSTAGSPPAPTPSTASAIENLLGSSSSSSDVLGAFAPRENPPSQQPPLSAITISSSSSSSTPAAASPPVSHGGGSGGGGTQLREAGSMTVSALHVAGHAGEATPQLPSQELPLLPPSPPHLCDDSSPSSSPELAAILAALDCSQRSAVCFGTSSPLLIQAGAGSGKTQTMAARIAFLMLTGVPARSILGICFTRQAAETLRQRVRAVLPPSMQAGAGLITLRTLHSFGLQCLRRFGVISAEAEVYDAGRQRALARRIVEQHATTAKSAEAVDALVDYVNKAKMKRDLPAPQLSPNVQEAYLFQFYEAALHDELNAVDFGDLQRMFFQILRPVRNNTAAAAKGEDGNNNDGGGGGGKDVSRSPSPSSQPAPPTTTASSSSPLRPSPVCEVLRRDYTHIVVDEFQDFNELQFEMLAYLAGDTCRVTCVGDPNQCIYEWRGAMPGIFPAWKRRFPATQMRILGVNYRSDGVIVSALNDLVGTAQAPFYHRQDRNITLVRCNADVEVEEAAAFIIEKIFAARLDARYGVGGGDSINSGGSSVPAVVNYGDMAVLCRTRRRVQALHAALERANIPVKSLKGVAPDSISIVRALLAYVKLVVKPDLDAEVRMALAGGPHFLPAKAVKGLFMSLSSISTERYQAGGGRANNTNANSNGVITDTATTTAAAVAAGGGGGGPPSISPLSFFAILSDAVFHGFAGAGLEKLADVSKKNRATIKKFIATIREAHDALHRVPQNSSCDIAGLIRSVAQQGGFEVEDPVTVDGSAPGVAAATGRKRKRNGGGGGSGRGRGNARMSSNAIADDVAAEFSHNHGGHQQQGDHQEGESDSSSSSSAAAAAAIATAQRQKRYGQCIARLPRLALDGDSTNPNINGQQYTTEEEAAMLAQGRVSVTELLLCAYGDVLDEIRAEAEGDALFAAAAAEAEAVAVLDTNAINNHTSCSGGDGWGEEQQRQRPGTAPQTPAVILRRVLDQFMTLLPSDDFGSLGSLADAHAPVTATSTSTDAVNNTTQQRQYPSGHVQSSFIDKVTVGTVHRAKGMEWPLVIIPDCWVGEFPAKVEKAEEKRIFYVAMSRAMTNLFLITARTSEDAKYTARRSYGSSNNNSWQQQQGGSGGADLDGAQGGSVRLVETPYIEGFKGGQVYVEEFAALKLAALGASGAL